MVSRLIKFLNRDTATMNAAALLLAVFSLLSQVLGLFRDRLLASLVGPSATLDVYYAAFRVPDFLYTSVASLFSVTVLIPFITSYLQDDKEGNKERMKRFSDSVFTVYCVGMMSICLIAAACMPLLTKITAPGFSPLQHQHLVLYSRLLLVSPFLLGLSSLLSSFAQVQKKFLSFAVAPLFYNIGILIGVVLLRPMWGMVGVVLGVVIGAIFYLVIQLPTLLSLHKLPTFIKAIDWKLIIKVMKLSLPRTVALSFTNFSFIIMSAFASLLAAGSISVFQFSYNIETTPLMIIGISYAVAAFPTLTRLYVEGLKQDFMDLIHRATRNIFFFSVPAALLFIVLRAQIVRVLLGAGQFSWNDTRLVAASLALFSISITAQCMILLLVRGYYAIGNTKTPLKINALSVLITASSAVVLLLSHRFFPLFQDFIESLLRIDGTTGSNIVLLPLAFSIGQVANASLLWVRFHKRLKGHEVENRGLTKTFFHTVSASILGAAVAYGVLVVLGDRIDQGYFWGILLQGVIAGFAGIVVYVGILMLLKNEDVYLFFKTLRSKFWKQKPLTPEQPDL
jgi:putative peptidoglycan lipid II flippase